MTGKEDNTGNGLASVSTLIVAIALLAGLAAAAAVGEWVGERRVSLPESYEDADLAVRGKMLKGWALGSEGLLADWYWMWSLQYIGGKLVRSELEEISLDDLRPLNPRLLHPLLDNAAELDPQFMAVYSYGASVLPAIDAHKAIELTEKGIAANPRAWRLHQYLGYIYWRMEEYEKAAEVYEAGSRIEEAPLFMRQMVAAMKTQGGSRETAREIYLQMLAEAEDQQSRANAELRLLEIDALDEIDAIQTVLSARKNSGGQCPATLREFFPELRKAELPRGRDFSINERGELVDPTGVPYVFNPEDCKVSIDPESRIPKIR